MNLPPRPKAPLSPPSSYVKQKKQGLKARLFLPTLIVLGIGMTGLRLNAVVNTLVEGKLYAPVQPVQAAMPPAPPPQAAAPAKDSPKTAATEPSSEDDESDDKPKSGAELDIINHLSERRQELDKREQSLDAREALIKVAEQRIDQKVKELETLRTQVQTLIGQANAAQQTQIENLVKIYETMKPKEAAKIFDTLDLPILLGVVQKMKPQRTAVIMANMSPEKAKEVTVALTKQDQLPQLK